MNHGDRRMYRPEPFYLSVAVLALVLVLAIVIGPVSAEEENLSVGQNVSAKLGPYMVTITAPIDIPEWILERNVTNELDIGNVSISTNAPSNWTMKLSIGADYTNWGDNGFNDAMEVYSQESAGWVDLVEGTILKYAGATETPVQIPINIRQFIDQDQGIDPPGDHTVVMTYTVAVLPPP